jgi:hypothetical protein
MEFKDENNVLYHRIRRNNDLLIKYCQRYLSSKIMISVRETCVRIRDFVKN